MKKKSIAVKNDEAIRNLLILSLLKDGVNPKVIATATGMPEKTIRNKFPMREIGKQAEGEE